MMHAPWGVIPGCAVYSVSQCNAVWGMGFAGNLLLYSRQKAEHL